MINQFKKLFVLLSCVIIAGCGKKEYNADLLIKNAKIYTVDSTFTIANAVVVTNGKITAVGAADTLEKKYLAKEVVDAGGKAVYPGFIDAHTHFFNYGLGLQEVHLEGTQSWPEILDSVQNYSKRNTEGWIIGRGWDQNDWKVKQFPNKAKLDSLFPMRPVILQRVDGHAAIANQAALNIAGIKPGDKLDGGQVETVNGKLTGVLIDNAVGLVRRKMPEPTGQMVEQAFTDAQRNCFAVGLTTIDDCGLQYNLINTITELQNKGALKMRMYVMLSDNQPNYDYLFKRGAVKTARLNVRAFKVYADGALGSRGACLLHPYTDRKDWSGFLLSSQKHFEEVAAKIAARGFQMCTHAIGDSANRVILKIYANALKGKNDRRWRIEHAQVIDPQDFDMFGANNVVPSVQPTHATSDMYWAAQRLGNTRVKNAYAYKQLLKQNGWIPLGTDFPVESINPMYTFYAATERKDQKGFPRGGFEKENALTRIEALKGMTIWAARSNFEEKEKGSLEPGKFADFVILDQDIMKIKGSSLPGVKVLKTYINGEKVYERK